MAPEQLTYWQISKLSSFYQLRCIGFCTIFKASLTKTDMNATLLSFQRILCLFGTLAKIQKLVQV